MDRELYNPHLRTKKTTAGIMGDVCLALVPAGIGAVVFFGIQALLLITVSVCTCILAEALWQILHHKTVTIRDYSAIVTGILIAFNVSSTTPIWVIILADIFAIIVVKQIFGGIGSNVFNPALVGRLFIMLVYPAKMMSYVMPMDVDTVAGATVLSNIKHGGEAGFSLMDAFLGKIPGALGETSALLLLIGFAYLVIKKEVNVMVSLSFFATVLLLTVIAGQDPLYHLFSGGLILGGCFMLTDYNFASRKGNWILGVLAGAIVVVMRVLGSFPEGVCYAILIVNCMSVLLEQLKQKHIYGMEEGR
ncbi:MAG: RnfABCDGE type electron transport complex subunit D [Lachnospiraceae bacterium]|nr:RnfABCDGE type electron transport complex subunit D [Lachnospiraceae bacterium]